MDCIHIWDFPYKVSISLKINFLINLRSKLKDKYKKLKLAYKSIDPNSNFKSFRNMLKPSYTNFRDLKTFINICRDLEISLEELEKNILAYRTNRGRTVIINPKLPIVVNPIFDMLIAHFFGDGNGWKGNCREFYLNYRQYDDEILNLFIQKIQRVFGRIKYKEDYFYKLKRIYLPTILSLVLSHYYSLKPKDFLSDKATLPRKMFTHSKDHLLAALIAFIIDEGTVNSSEIVIGLHNKKLILDLSNICKKLKYEFSVTREKFNPKRYILYILANGVKNFWEDYKNLKKKYPEIFLGYKEDQIKQFILRKEKLWRSNNGGSTKNNIINLLKQKSRTIKELAQILNISRQGIKFHLQQLEKIGLIKRGGKGKKNSDIYDLLKYVQFPVTKRGRSRQYGVTAEKIIQLLMELGSLDTKQISKRLKMKRTSVYTILKKLEKEKKIIAINKKVYRTHPTTVWSLI